MPTGATREIERYGRVRWASKTRPTLHPPVAHQPLLQVELARVQHLPLPRPGPADDQHHRPVIPGRSADLVEPPLQLLGREMLDGGQHVMVSRLLPERPQLYPRLSRKG